MESSNPLTIAASSGNLEEVKLLLEKGFPVDSVNEFQHTALQAAPASKYKIVNILLEYGADPNLREPVTGGIPLHNAARQGAIKTLELLLEYGSNVNIQDEANRDTAAHIAAKKGNLEAFKMLRLRTDMTIKNNNGDTPVSIAEQH